MRATTTSIPRRHGASKTMMIKPSPTFVPVGSNVGDKRGLEPISPSIYREPPSPGIHLNKTSKNRYLAQMDRMSFLDGQYENQAEKNYAELKGKVFYDPQSVEVDLERELMERSQLRASKFEQGSELQEKYVNYKERISGVTQRLNDGATEIKLDRQNYNDLFMKMRSGIQFEGMDTVSSEGIRMMDSKFQFPLQQHQSQVVQPTKKRQPLPGIVIEESKSEVEKNQTVDEELLNITMGDVNYNPDERSNADNTSMTSRSKQLSTATPVGGVSTMNASSEREQEYSSLRDYTITEIQKLTELFDYEQLPSLPISSYRDELADEIEEQDKLDMNQQAVVMKERAKKRIQLNKRKRVVNFKVEKPLEELLEIGVTDKIDYFFSFDHIEKVSLCYNRSSEIHPDNLVQYQREISDQARDVLCIGEQYRGPQYEEIRMDLLQIEDIYIDEKEVTFEDITNIISDRIPDKMLFKPIDQDFLADHCSRFAQFSAQNPTKKVIIEELLYTNKLTEIKQFQYAQMKYYMQQTKTWENKEMQSNYKEIVMETKAVTDWIMEDLYHIRKATLSSQEFNFDKNVSKVLQTQLYHKFEEKLMLLLQIILYRENQPAWRVPQKQPSLHIGKQMEIEKEKEQERLRAERMIFEEQRMRQEKKFEVLHHSEKQMIKDLKVTMEKVHELQHKFVDNRSRLELLRIFLVDYNEIVKYKNFQLQKLEEIDSKISEIDVEKENIKKKTVFQRLYEEKIGHLKSEMTLQKQENRVVSGFTQKVKNLEKKRDSILQNSAQLFPYSENVEDDDDDDETKQEKRTPSPKLKQQKSLGKLPVVNLSRSPSPIGMSRSSSTLTIRSTQQRDKQNQFSRMSNRNDEPPSFNQPNPHQLSLLSSSHLVGTKAMALRKSTGKGLLTMSINSPLSNTATTTNKTIHDKGGSILHGFSPYNNRNNNMKSNRPAALKNQSINPSSPFKLNMQRAYDDNSSTTSKRSIGFPTTATASSAMKTTPRNQSFNVKPFATPTKDRSAGKSNNNRSIQDSAHSHSHLNPNRSVLTPSSLSTVLNTDWAKLLKVSKKQ